MIENMYSDLPYFYYMLIQESIDLECQLMSLGIKMRILEDSINSIQDHIDEIFQS